MFSVYQSIKSLILMSSSHCIKKKTINLQLYIYLYACIYTKSDIEKKKNTLLLTEKRIALDNTDRNIIFMWKHRLYLQHFLPFLLPSKQLFAAVTLSHRHCLLFSIVPTITLRLFPALGAPRWRYQNHATWNLSLN